jgi:hypothetical protein
MFEFISKKFADIKILHEGYTADYFLNRMKTNALFPILFIQNNLFKKKNQVPTFFIRLLHSVHFREILSGYFLFSRFDWSIFVTQLVARHMKEIIRYKNLGRVIFGKINSRIQTLTLGNYLFIIQLLKTQLFKPI